MIIWELLVLALLVLLNGFFAMAELAIVSARRVRLQQMAEAGKRGAAAALRLMDDPVKLLSTTQVGITLIGIVAGAYSGTTLAEPLAALLARHSRHRRLCPCDRLRHGRASASPISRS